MTAEIRIKKVRDDLFAVEVKLPDGAVHVATTCKTEEHAHVYTRGLSDGYQYARMALGSGLTVRSMVQEVGK
jgi:hypothetical protein